MASERFSKKNLNEIYNPIWDDPQRLMGVCQVNIHPSSTFCDANVYEELEKRLNILNGFKINFSLYDIKKFNTAHIYSKISTIL